MKSIVKISLISSLLAGACLSANVMAQTPSFNRAGLSVASRVPIVNSNQSDSLSARRDYISGHPTVEPRAPNALLTAGFTRSQKETLTRLAYRVNKLGWMKGLNVPQNDSMDRLKHQVKRAFPGHSQRDILTYLLSVKDSAQSAATSVRLKHPRVFSAATNVADYNIVHTSLASFRNRGTFFNDESLMDEESSATEF
ncbi:MAG: hypothetical protein CMF39_02715 [Legionellaceae bacterium]|nr:hypothetical protein [Legionellaceae bacterium]|tara:strand:- start:340 stop:930 length:591 start_codon:yes stop_codon:yes gene_type:complete